jgi:hypothetical protein
MGRDTTTNESVVVSLVGGAVLVTDAGAADLLAGLAPSTPYSSAALEGSAVLKASAGVFRSLYVQLDPALAAGTYYVQLLTASATVPADGAVTHLRPPQTIVHSLGQAEGVNFDEGVQGIAFTVGCTACVSSTQFTKTIVASSALFSGSVS